jgi:anhydro-N-acetylmuramic acid kinase
MIVIGMISGTSVDAIDVAAARFEREGEALCLVRLGHAERAWPEQTRRRLLAALPPASVSLAEVCALDVLVGEAFADAAMAAVRELAGGRADLICSHGQNLFHWVEGGRARGTLQLGQPAIIAEATGVPVVSDLRARDVAAGGQGAPLASTLDALWLAGTSGPRAALNLGGIANITVVGRAGDAVLAYDTGPASCLLDLEASRLTAGRQRYDVDGALALAGRVRPDLLERLLEEPYFALPPPKSTGRELFNRGYVAARLTGLAEVSGADLMATLTALTAQTVADACRRHGVTEVVASGGGVRNPALMAALAAALRPARLDTADAWGLPADGKEAYLFALLGYLSWHGLPGTVGGATGARGDRILGRISPGRERLALPGPTSMPARLVVKGDDSFALNQIMS